MSCPSAGLVAASLVGIVALVKDKMPWLWILYCMGMACLCLTIFVGGVTALSRQLTDVEKKMNETFVGYVDLSRAGTELDKKRAKANVMVDLIQEHHDVSPLTPLPSLHPSDL